MHVLLNCKICGKEYRKVPSTAAKSKYCSWLCSHQSKKTHGMDGTKIYRVWVEMKRRCLNQNYIGYHDYGGRGISVCESWYTFENFYADMGGIPFPGAQIDRIDNNGNYEPENCRWVTRQENNRNKRSNVIVQLNGKSVCLAVACREIGVDYYKLKDRRKRKGLTSQQALDSYIKEV